MSFVFVHKQVGNSTGTSFLIFQSCFQLQYGIESYAKLCFDFPNCHPLVFFDEGINFLLIVFSCGVSQSVTVWQISDVCVFVFKMCHISSNTMMPVHMSLYA
jgi:hypothetical protein